MKILKITLLTLLVSGCATLDKVNPTGEQIAIDGSGDEWPQLVRYDNDVGILYGVTYDNNYLYVLAKAYEEDAKRRIVNSGLTVWVDANGKKKKKFGIKYPMMGGAPDKTKRSGTREPNRSQVNILDESQLNNMMIHGLVSNEMQIVQKDRLKTGLDVMIGFDSAQNLLYEMKIPLALLKQKTKDDLEKLAIGFEVSNTVRPDKENLSPSGSGGRGGGRSGGGRSGGGSSGGGGRGNSQPGSQGANSNSSLIFWYLVELNGDITMENNAGGQIP